MNASASRVASTILVLSVLLPGCVSTIRATPANIVTPPPASARAIRIRVGATVPDEPYDQFELLTGLQDAFRAMGYQVDAGDLVLTATVTRADRGNSFVNTFVGMGLGRDRTDVLAELGNVDGTRYLSVVVTGEVLDKRYATTFEMLRGIAKRIATEVTKASR